MTMNPKARLKKYLLIKFLVFGLHVPLFIAFDGIFTVYFDFIQVRKAAKAAWQNIFKKW